MPDTSQSTATDRPANWPPLAQLRDNRRDLDAPYLIDPEHRVALHRIDGWGRVTVAVIEWDYGGRDTAATAVDLAALVDHPAFSVDDPFAVVCAGAEGIDVVSLEGVFTAWSVRLNVLNAKRAFLAPSGSGLRTIEGVQGVDLAAWVHQTRALAREAGVVFGRDTAAITAMTHTADLVDEELSWPRRYLSRPPENSPDGRVSYELNIYLWAFDQFVQAFRRVGVTLGRQAWILGRQGVTEGVLTPSHEWCHGDLGLPLTWLDEAAVKQRVRRVERSLRPHSRSPLVERVFFRLLDGESYVDPLK